MNIKLSTFVDMIKKLEYWDVEKSHEIVDRYHEFNDNTAEYDLVEEIQLIKRITVNNTVYEIAGWLHVKNGLDMRLCDSEHNFCAVYSNDVYQPHPRSVIDTDGSKLDAYDLINIIVANNGKLKMNDFSDVM